MTSCKKCNVTLTKDGWCNFCKVSRVEAPKQSKVAISSMKAKKVRPNFDE